MKKLLFILLMCASPSFAQDVSLIDLSHYLNNLKTAKGAFTQINPDGSISTGTIYLKRPGRMRFEYNPPEKSLVLSGGGQVAVFDAKAGEPTRFPLNQTPLSIILARNVDLTRTNMVVGHVSDGTRTTITVQDPDRTEYGFMQLVFTNTPIQLRQWIVDDGSGAKTTVIIGDWAEGVPVSGNLFNIQKELEQFGQ